MSLTVRAVRYFIAVYEEGSISRAAERENIVQPAISTQIKQLEQDLNHKLFERSAQGVQPTPAGQHFYQQCKSLLAVLLRTQQEMRDFGGTISGQLSFGLMSSICRGALAQTLQSYIITYPDVDMRILEGNSADLVEKVTRNDLDFAVCSMSASQSSLSARLLHRDSFVLVTGIAKAFEPFMPYDPDRFPELKLVLPSKGNAIRRLIDAEIKKGGIRPKRVIEIDGLGATMQFIAKTDWSTLLPATALAGDLYSNTFLINPLPSKRMVSDIYVLHRPDMPLALPSERMVENIQTSLKRIDRVILSRLRV